MINIILADDHKIVRDGIRSLLSYEEDLNVIGEGGNGRDVINLINSGLNPDVILTDIHMPDMDGFELVREVKQMGHQAKCMMMSMVDDEKNIAEAFEKGATAYLFKNVSAEELAFSIRHVNRAGRYICTEISLRIADRVLGNKTENYRNELSPVDLSEREINILQHISDGYTNEEIADMVFSSKRTIETNRYALIQKFNAKNTAQMIKFALLQGIVK